MDPRTTVGLDELQQMILAAWSRDTSDDPATWSSTRRSAGQCWTSAYVIRHFFGGEIVFAEVLPHSDPVERHAWNILPDGTVVDMTRDQFAAGQTFRDCLVPEAMVVAVAGMQAELLLTRVKAVIEEPSRHRRSPVSR